MRATSFTWTRDNWAEGANGIEIGGWSGESVASKMCERQVDAVFLAPGPTTRAIRRDTKPNPLVAARFSPTSSTIRFEAPYGSSGAAGSHSRRGREVCDDPYTLMELPKTKRPTPCVAASRSKLSVPVRFTWPRQQDPHGRRWGEPQRGE